MKNPTEQYMQLDFGTVKNLGKLGALLLNYLIFKSDDRYHNIVCLTRNEILSDLDMTKSEYIKACDILSSKNLIEIIENYRARINGFKLLPDNIVKCIGSPESNIGSPESNIGSPESNIGSPESNIGSQEATIKQANKQINKQQTTTVDNPSQQQAVSLKELALSEVVIDWANDSQEVVTLKLNLIEARKNIQDIPSMEVGFSDTPLDVQQKVKKARKARKTKLNAQDIQPDKWLPFLDFIKNEFSILYPKHRNKNAAIQASLDFAKANDIDEVAILDIVSKIKKHYLVYCQENEFAVGPARYITDQMWTTSLKTETRTPEEINYQERIAKYSTKHF